MCCKTSHPSFNKNYGMRYPWEIHSVWKRNVSAKINQCALWNIKRQFLWLPWWNHDNARNKIAKSLTLASFTVALNKFVFLASERQKGGLFLGACFPRKSWNFKALKCICQLLVLIETLLRWNLCSGLGTPSELRKTVGTVPWIHCRSIPWIEVGQGVW